MSSVSVIVPCYNCAVHIAATLAAILQSDVAVAEIICVDDCSTDQTFGVIQDFARHSPVEIILIRQDKNGGPAKARNAGAALARGDFLFFVDSDTELKPDAIGKFLARVAQDHADVVVGIYHWQPLNDGHCAWYKSLLYGYLLGTSGVVPYDQFSASCAGVRAELFRVVGGYNENFPAGLDFENEELGHRLSRQGKMLLDPEIMAGHHFPDLKKMTRTFFQRTGLWMESFLERRQFNSVAGTPQTGLATISLLAAVGNALLGFIYWPFLVLAVAFYLYFLRGYAGFFEFVRQKQPQKWLWMFVLCHYFSLVIALGACFGALRFFLGGSNLSQVRSYHREG